jgi:hypothetical protein
VQNLLFSLILTYGIDMFLDWYLCITCSFKICCRFILILVVFACPSVASGVFESGQGTKRIMDSV